MRIQRAAVVDAVCLQRQVRPKRFATESQVQSVLAYPNSRRFSFDRADLATLGSRAFVFMCRTARLLCSQSGDAVVPFALLSAAWRSATVSRPNAGKATTRPSGRRTKLHSSKSVLSTLDTSGWHSNAAAQHNTLGQAQDRKTKDLHAHGAAA